MLRLSDASFLVPRLMVNSSPHMNNIILVGGIVMILSTFSLSFDSDFPHDFTLTNGTNDTIATRTVVQSARDRYTAWCNVS